MKNRENLLNKAPFGVAYHEIILDENGKPVDYRFLEVNRAFENFTGLKSEDILGKTATEIFPGIRGYKFDWIAFFGKIAEQGDCESFEQYFQGLDKWFKGVAYSDEKKYFTVTFIESTEYNLAQKNFVASKNEYETLLNNIQGIIYRCKYDAEWTMLFISANVDAVSGYTADELLYNKKVSYRQLIHHEDRERVSMAVSDAIAARKSWEVEYRIFHKGSDIRWAYEKGKAVCDEHGKILFLDGFIMDITDKKINEIHLNAFFSVNLDLLCISDFKGNFIKVNKEWESVLGYSSEQLENRNFFEFLHPDDVKATTEKMSVLKENKSVFDFVNRYRRVDGSYRFIEWRSTAQNNVIYSAARDITERLAIENKLKLKTEQYELAINGTNDGIWDWDLRTNELFLSKRWKNMLGYEEAELKNEGATFTSLIYENDIKRVNKYVRDYLEGRTKEYSIEFRMKRKDGSLCWILARGEALRDMKGKPFRMAGSHTDITKRKIAENKTAESEQRFKALFYDSPVSKIIYDEDTGEIIDANKAALKCFGADRPSDLNNKEFINESPYLPDDMLKWIRKAAGEGKQQFEWKNKRVNGEIFWELITLIPIVLKEEERVLSVGIDITERKQADEALTSQRNIYEQVLEQSMAGYWDWDISTGYEYLSPTFKKMFGYEDAEIENRPEAWQKLIFPEDLTAILACFDKHVETKGREPFYSEVRYRHKNGQTVWVICTGKVIEWESSGKPKRAVGCHIDITERKRREKLMEMRVNLIEYASNHAMSELLTRALDEIEPILNSSICFLHFVLPDQKTISLQQWSSATLKRFYKSDAGDIHYDIEKAGIWIECIRERKGVIHNDYSSLQNKKGLPEGHAEIVREMVVPVLRKNSIVAIIGVGNKQSDYTKEDLDILTSLADITWEIIERKQAEEDLKKSKEQAELANKAKSTFLANMSHEIRTPLNGVIGFAELLQKTQLNKIQEQYCDNINTSGRALLGIINDILDFSKIEAGKLELDVIETDVVELMKQATDILKYHAGKKDLELLLNIQPDLPRLAKFDPVRLNQVIVNLLSNAVKFTEKGEVELKVTFSPVSDDRGIYNFYVRDTGVGIPEIQRKKLFKAFSQADSSITRKYGGTGLGLIISNLLTEKMGASIQIESTCGEGSLFYFSIETQCSRKEYFDEKRNYKPLPIKSVLVVDDNKTNRRILEDNFKYWGVGFSECDSGLSALEMLEKHKFDLLIIDCHMPHIDGIDTIRMIRNKLSLSPQDLPAIILHSSSDNQTLREECKKLGIRFNLVKPVIADELYYYIRNIYNEKAVVKPVKSSEKSLAKKEKYAGGLNQVILIAEDLPINVMLVKALITKMRPGTEFIEAANGQIALDMVKKRNVNLVLMDVQMPVMDGLEATQKIREWERQNNKLTRLPIVALTADAMKEEQETALQCGMDAYLTKPIKQDELKACLNKYLLNVRKTDKYVQASLKEGKLFDKLISFDLKRGFKNADCNKEFYVKLLETFRAQLMSEFSRLVSLLKNKRKAKEASAMLHSLKGISGTLGAIKLYNLIKDIEINLKNGASVDLSRISELEKCISSIIAELKSLSENSKPEISVAHQKGKDFISMLVKKLEQSEYVEDYIPDAVAAYFDARLGKGASEELICALESFEHEKALQLLNSLLNRSGDDK